jgi:hypothetical protein
VYRSGQIWCSADVTFAVSIRSCREKSNCSADSRLIVATSNKTQPAIDVFLFHGVRSEGDKMKKVSVLAVALSVATLGIPVLAQGKPQEMSQEEKKPKLMDIKGTVKADGDKITFVTDGDSKSWDVVNPETLKDHVGHHVELSAHVYADKGQIHVMKVTML